MYLIYKYKENLLLNNIQYHKPIPNHIIYISYFYPKKAARGLLWLVNHSLLQLSKLVVSATSSDKPPNRFSLKMAFPPGSIYINISLLSLAMSNNRAYLTHLNSRLWLIHHGWRSLKIITPYILHTLGMVWVLLWSEKKSHIYIYIYILDNRLQTNFHGIKYINLI